jgi:hypothetical protein
VVVLFPPPPAGVEVVVVVVEFFMGHAGFGSYFFSQQLQPVRVIPTQTRPIRPTTGFLPIGLSLSPFRGPRAQPRTSAPETRWTDKQILVAAVVPFRDCLTEWEGLIVST